MCRLSTEFYENWLSSFCVIMLRNKQINKRRQKHNLLGNNRERAACRSVENCRCVAATWSTYCEPSTKTGLRANITDSLVDFPSATSRQDLLSSTSFLTKSYHPEISSKFVDNFLIYSTHPGAHNLRRADNEHAHRSM